MDWLQLLGGGLLLYFGAEWLVAGASALAVSLGVPRVLVGLTVIAYGTSAPEVLVGVAAASSGHGDVALGNVIGSNIANVGLILGVAALIRPAPVDASLAFREVPVLLGTAVAVPLFLLDGEVSRLEALGLLGAAVLYTAVMVRQATAEDVRAASRDAALQAEAADAAGAPAPTGRAHSAATALVGLAVLLGGAKLFVDAAVRIAHEVGVSDRLVGLTIVAIGTSLPELVTSVVAARRGRSDLAVGNVVGSNIFNVLLCLGASALAGHVGAPWASVRTDLAVFVGVTLLAVVLIRSERVVTRAEGAVAVGAYVAFLALAVVPA
jgi:cation:H+ antiporter